MHQIMRLIILGLAPILLPYVPFDLSYSPSVKPSAPRNYTMGRLVFYGGSFIAYSCRRFRGPSQMHVS